MWVSRELKSRNKFERAYPRRAVQNIVAPTTGFRAPIGRLVGAFVVSNASVAWDPEDGPSHVGLAEGGFNPFREIEVCRGAPSKGEAAAGVRAISENEALLWGDVAFLLLPGDIAADHSYSPQLSDVVGAFSQWSRELLRVPSPVEVGVVNDSSCSAWAWVA